MKGRFEWWPSWIEKKHKYARTTKKQMDEDAFYSIAAGTGVGPIFQASTFKFDDVNDGANRFLGESPSGEKPFARIYTRLGNPNTEHLEKTLFQLECQHIIDKALEADEKVPTIGTFVFGSGMGAISTTILGIVRSGDAIMVGSVYGCTDSFMRFLQDRFGVEIIFVDTTKTELVQKAFDEHPNIVAVLLETPVNPTLDMSDIEAVSKITEENEALLIVDNTFCTPFLQQPFRLGADIVVHSLTKYVNGHSTSIGGASLGPFELFSGDMFLAYKDIGATPSPFDSWLNSNFIQDLGHRVKLQSNSAADLAAWLEAHDAIDHVVYPGLKSHQQNHLIGEEAQMRSGGAMISFELKGGYDAGVKLMNYFAQPNTPMKLAVSLGSVVSYIQHPASMTHSVVPEADRMKRGITPGLVRLSVGVEGLSTLKAHLDKGLSL